MLQAISISPSKTDTAGPVIMTGRPRSFPRDRQLAAAHAHAHRARQQTAADAADNRRAGSGPAGQRLAGAALEHAQPDRVRIDDLHEAGIDAGRKARMVLDQRPLGRDRCRIDVGDDLDRVRVAHADRADRDRLASHV